MTNVKIKKQGKKIMELNTKKNELIKDIISAELTAEERQALINKINELLKKQKAISFKSFC